MGKIWLPIINIVLAVALFFGFTDGVISSPLKEDASGNFNGGVKALNQKSKNLNEALANARQLQEKVNQITADYNNFSELDQQKLDALVPDSVDNIQLIIDVNNIATRNGLTIKGAKMKTEAERSSRVTTAGGVVSKTSTNALQTETMSFSVMAPYETFQKFIIDLSKSMRVVDIASVSFDSNEKNIYQYNVDIKTYWMK